jgi:hypothetical protein
METTVKTRLKSIQLGQPQTYQGMALVPLIAPTDGSFQYLTLNEALATGDLIISEVSAAGSVPELMVVNKGNRPILLVDGEELAGAKQNRVLNTSILVKPASEIKIPVSCTEQGRWSYSSKNFGESGHIMSQKSRSKKVSSVYLSLLSCGKHLSDQREVWENIGELRAKSGAPSFTSAMQDVFTVKAAELAKSGEAFKRVANQIGFIAFLRGNPVGLDLISLTSAYSRLHPKLVQSYALEGLFHEDQQAPPVEVISTQARKFIEEIAMAEESEFPSIGHGVDHRFKGRALAGAALIHEGEVIHATFLTLEETQSQSNPNSKAESRVPPIISQR